MEATNDQTVIGYIVKAEGSVLVADENGQVRIAEIGDPLYLNEKVVNDSEVNVLIELVNNQMLNLAAQQQVVMQFDLLGTTVFGEREETTKDVEVAADASTQVIPPANQDNAATSENNDQSQSESDSPVEDTFVREAIINHENVDQIDSFSDQTQDFQEDATASGEREQQNIQAVSDESIPESLPPQASDIVLAINEDTPFSFNRSLFAQGSALESITVISLPSQGTLSLNNVRILPGQRVLAQDLDDLLFQPGANDNGSDYTSFQFRISDGLKSSSVQQVTIDITPVNDVPVVEDQFFSVTENAVADGSFIVGRVEASDVDTGQAKTYSITAGNEDGKFAIDSETGELTLAGALDRETTDSYSLTIEVTDSGNPPLTDTATITIGVNDFNEAPVVLDQSFMVDENVLADGSVVVGSVSASDVDHGQDITYAITSGNDDGRFAIDSDTGEITVVDTLDHETINSYRLTVEVSDNGSPALSSTATITVNINDLNEAPVVSDQVFTVDENVLADGSVVVGSVNASDVDDDQAKSYAITGGNDDGRFAIDPDTGEITVVDTLDHETIDSYRLTVEVSDNGSPALSSTATITVNINDLNEAPVVSDQGFTVDENVLTDGSVVVGSVSASDVDDGQAKSYAITGGNDDGRFSIDPDTGEITVVNALDHEFSDTYNLTVEVTDDGSPALSDTATIAIDINDLNEAPTVTVPTSASYTEGDGALSVLNTLILNDPEGTLEGATIQFTEHNCQDHVAEDKLEFTDQNGIAGSYDAANGVLTLTGTASVTEYQTALRSISYTNLSDSPDKDDRILSVTVNDGFIDSNVANTTLSITAVNDGPAITGAGNLVDETMDTANQEGLAQHIQIIKTGGSHAFSVGEKIELTFTNSEDNSESYTVTYTINDTAAQRIAPGLTHAILNSDPGIGCHVSVVSEGGSVIGSSYRNVIGFDDPNRPPFNLTTVVKDASDQVISTDTVMIQNTTHVYGVNYNGAGNEGTAQEETLTIPAGLQAGQTVKLFVNDLEVSHTVAAGETVTDIRDALLSQFSDFDISQAVSAVANGSDKLSLTAVNPGEPFDAYGVTTSVSDLFTLDVDENTISGTVVGTVGASDRDGDSDTLTYALTDDASGRFAINSNTGEITVAGALDHESAASHTVTVSVTDSQGASSQQQVTIQVRDVNDAPVLSDTLDTAVGTESAINTTLDNDQSEAVLSPMADGGYMVVWHSEEGGSHAIKAQKYAYVDETRTITIADHSFESVALADSSWQVQPTASAWTFTTGAGIHDYGAAQLTAQASDGENAAWINAVGASISQTLSENFQRNNDYTLQVDIGNRQDSASSEDYTVRVSAGGVVLASDGSVVPAEGSFATLTLNIDGQSIPEGSAAIGQPLTIELIKNSGNHQASFDNVRMTVAEPSLELNPIGDEFQINTTAPASNQDVRNPVVATLDNGNYAVVWDLIQPGSWIQSHMRVFDANGNEVKTEFNIGTSHYATDVTALTDNRFATVSIDSSDSFNAKIHIFDASGNETSVINAGSAGSWGYGGPDIEALDNGGFAVVWRSNATTNDSASLRIYDASGNPVNSAISFGGSNPDNFRELKVEELPNGELVTVYQSGDDVFFQRWSSTGTTIGSPVQANTTTADTQSQFSIESLPDGGFFIIWKSSGGQDGDGQGIVGRRFNASGTAVTDEVVINTTTTGEQFDPQLVRLTNGALEAIWTSDHTGDNEIFGSTIGLGGGTGANQVQENALNGTLVGKAAVSDFDDADTHTYTLVNDAGGRFAIDTNTGNITVADGTLLDHEINDSHTIRVRVTDNGGLSSEQDIVIQVQDIIVIQVQDINEAPDVSGAVTATVPENLEAHTVTQAFLLTNASDVDDGDTLSVQDVSVNGITAHRHDFQTSFAAGTGGNVAVNGNTLTLTSGTEENVVLIDTTGGSTRDTNLHLDFTAAPTDQHATRNNFIVFDYVDANNYKAIGSYDGDGTAHWVVEHWVNGASTRLAEYNSTDNSNINVDRHYEVDIISNRVTLTVDGVEKIAHQFSENISDGQLGVMNRGNAVSTYTLNGADWDIYPDNEHAVYDNNDGTWTILPGDDLNGDLTLAYNVSDGQLTTAATAVIPVNRTPDATIELSSTSGISDDALPVETTAQGDSLTVTSVNGQAVASSGTTSIAGEYGTLDIAADGSWNYNLNSNYATVDLDSDLIAKWNFDGNANDNAPSDSIADNGVLTGNAAYTSDSVSGSAVTLDGTGDYVQIATTTELGNYSGTVGQRTISLFFKLDPSNSKGGKQVLYEEGGSSHGFAIYLDGGKIYVGGWENSNTAYVSKDITYLDSDNWHHIALRMDDANNTLRGFLDGEVFGNAAGIQVPAHTGTVAFGGPGEGNQAFDFHNLDDGVGTQFNGLIDEGRVYNRALTGREIDVLGNLDQTETFTYGVSDGTHISTATLDINVLHTLDSTSGLDGTAAGETLTGSLFAEQIDGMAGDDTLIGNGGNDLLIGGSGNDILTGGDGEDIFDFDFSHIGTAASPAHDTITDFNISEGDVLDIRDILIDEENNDLTQYLSFDQTDASNPILEIRDTAGGDITQKVTLQGVNLSSLGSTDAEIINGLLNNGNLNTDQ